MTVERNYEREFVRTFFTSPTAVEGEEDSAKLLRSAAQLRGMEAPDVWVPDNEDATAPSMRAEGVENIIEVVGEHGDAFPGEIHPRVVWHRDDPTTRQTGFEQMRAVADPEGGAGDQVDGFVIPEVGDVDDWKKADEALTVVEAEHGLPEGSLSMSVIVESAAAEIALDGLREEMGKPSNNLERLFLLVDGEVDYTKDMRAMTPTGGTGCQRGRPRRRRRPVRRHPRRGRLPRADAREPRDGDDRHLVAHARTGGGGEPRAAPARQGVVAVGGGRRARGTRE
jgi:bifunctional (S)-malyl-CoA lyase/thioesterase